MGRIRFDKIYCYDRVDEPVYLNIPFAEGILNNKDCLRIVQNGKAKPVQTKVTSRHKDGSIRHLFVRFFADIPANHGAEADFEITAEPEKVMQTDIVAEEVAGGFKVSTGAVTFEVKDNTENMFAYIRTNHGSFYPAENFHGPFLSSIGRSYHMEYINWEIIESGAVAVMLKCDGKLVAEDYDASYPCEVRVTVYAGKPWIELDVRLVNNTDQDLTIKEYGFSVVGDALSSLDSLKTMVANSSYSTDYITSENGGKVEKIWDEDEIIMTNNEHCPEVLYGTFFGDITGPDGGLTVTMYQAAQNYPKAVSAYGIDTEDGLKAGKVDMWLLPNLDNRNITLRAGMAKEQSMMLYFHGAQEAKELINHRTLCYQMPDRPLLDPSVYEESGTMIDIFVKKPDFDAEDALILCADAHARCFGFINWGDAPDPGYTNQGRGNGKFVWSNNEYDFPHASYLQYARTGIRRYLDIALVTGRHQRDIDICHTPGNPEFYLGQWEHCADHTAFRMVCSHQWVEGILDCYHASGDERYLEAAIGIGDNILYLLTLPKYQDNGDATARETGWALRTLLALYIETWDEKWLSRNDWIVNKFIAWNNDMGGWISKYLDNTLIRVPFMTSVAVGSLMRCYRVLPTEELKAVILSAVDDLMTNSMMSENLFYYKELPSLCRIAYNPLPLEALAIGYELTGDDKYLKAGLRLFKKVTARISPDVNGNRRKGENSVIFGVASPKTFAQTMVPYASFYRALDKAGMIE